MAILGWTEGPRQSCPAVRGVRWHRIVNPAPIARRWSLKATKACPAGEKRSHHMHVRPGSVWHTSRTVSPLPADMVGPPRRFRVSVPRCSPPCIRFHRNRPCVPGRPVKPGRPVLPVEPRGHTFHSRDTASLVRPALGLALGLHGCV